MMKERIDTMLVCFIFSTLATFGGIRKGINLNYLTEAHQDLIKAYPCEAKFEQYYLDVNYVDL